MELSSIRIFYQRDVGWMQRINEISNVNNRFPDAVSV